MPRNSTSKDIDLVSMPFYSAFSSCYQIEYLATILRKRKIKVTCHHLYYKFGRDFLKTNNTNFYKALTSIRYFGDYLVLARKYNIKASEIITEMLNIVPVDIEINQQMLIDFYSNFNKTVADFINIVKINRPRIVGFSVTHYQLIPSLFLAEKIKSDFPNIQIIFGGYFSSIQTANDLLKKFPYIDYIVYGEGENALLSFLNCVKTDNHLKDKLIISKPVCNLFELPNYDKFILEGPLRNNFLEYMSFSFEISRGCYWNNCNFCNFNATYNNYKMHDPDSVLKRMDHLHKKFGIRKFIFLDSSLPPKFASFLIKKKLKRNYKIDCELRTDFSYKQLYALKNFGIDRIQIGIESFSSAHLESMNKNSSLIDNLYFLKLCLELSIEPIYGILINRPGDLPVHYKEMISVIRLIQHLPPPKYISEFDLRPDSDLFYQRKKFNIKIHFPKSVFESLFFNKDYNCEFRPSFKIYPNLKIENELIILEKLIKTWQKKWKKSRKTNTPILQIVETKKGYCVLKNGTKVLNNKSIDKDEIKLFNYLQDPKEKNKLLHYIKRNPMLNSESLEKLLYYNLVYYESDKYLSLVPSNNIKAMVTMKKV